MATDNPSQWEHPIVKYSELASQRRGIILNLTINLEKMIDWRISIFYIQEAKKREELEDMIICGLPFRTKISILMRLFKKYDKEIFIAYPEMKKDLNDIRDSRNEMAHSWLDATVTFAANKRKFKPTVTNLKSKGVENIYDEKKITELSELILKYTHIIMNWSGHGSPSYIEYIGVLRNPPPKIKR